MAKADLDFIVNALDVLEEHLGSRFGFQRSCLRVSDSGFRVSGFRASGFGILGSGFRASGFGFRFSGFRASGFRFRVQGSGFRVPGSGFGDWKTPVGFRVGGGPRQSEDRRPFCCPSAPVSGVRV